jgi:succinate dehydrogenase / fumarate reductase cytochrome b subunit
MRYRVKTGFAAWLLMRATGVVLAFYIFCHVWVASHLLAGKDSYDRLMTSFHSPFWRALEMLFVAAFVIHAANGLRLIWIDLFEGSRIQKPLFWASIGVAVLIIGAMVMAPAPIKP